MLASSSSSPVRVAIIGGGAAGLMAAVSVREAEPTTEVIIIERNDGLGKKVIISGGGRCNVTTGIDDVRAVLARYPRGGKFLTSAMHRFPPAMVREWFESRGVPLKVEDDLRAFPVSDDGRDIVRVFERLFAADPGTRVLLRTHVTAITRAEDGGFRIVLRSASGRGTSNDGRDGVGGEASDGSATRSSTSEGIHADRVILTTGGQAYRHTGSTGDGYAFAVALGHSLTPLGPGLNAMFTREHWPAEVSGVSYTRARLSATLSNGGNAEFTGAFLFTHRGISGPAVFALSSLTAFEPYDAVRPMRVAIDLFPDASESECMETLRERIAESPSKNLRNVIAALVPKSLADACVTNAALPGETRAAEVSKKDVRRTIAWLKAIPLHIVQRGAGDEFVTAGGVPLNEIDPSTMRSRICPGLSFAGEIMDVDGFTGGFNLQASWATGRLAGERAVE